MYSSVSSDELHNGGYHGIDLYNAERIAEEGFLETNGDVFFAPLDNLHFAQINGERRAREKGNKEYGIVQAMFPGNQLEFGLGGDQIRIPVDEIGRITIVGLQVYDLEQARLILRLTRVELQNRAN